MDSQFGCGCNNCDRFCCEKKVIVHKPECRLECHDEKKCHKERVCHWEDECKCRMEKEWVCRDVLKCRKEKVKKCHDECKCHFEKKCECKCDEPKYEEKWECNYEKRPPCPCEKWPPCHCDQPYSQGYDGAEALDGCDDGAVYLDDAQGIGEFDGGECRYDY